MIFCFGLSHATAPVELRERVAVAAKAVPEAVQQLIALEQEIGIGRATVDLITASECVVEQRAFRRKCCEQRHKKRPMQIIDDDDGVEAFIAERPKSRFEIRRPRFDVGYCRQCGECDRITIYGQDLAPSRCEETRVPATARGEIQHARPGRDERRKARNPG